MPHIRISLAAPVAGILIILSFIVVVGTGMIATTNLKVGGPLYNQIKAGLGVAADVEPPPEFIVEAYLEASLALNERNATALERHRQRLIALHKAFDDRHTYWANQSLPDDIRNDLLVTSYKPAEDFWRVNDQRLLPALEAGDWPAAYSAYAIMNEDFEIHQSMIAALTKNIEKGIARTEATAKLQAGYFSMMVWGVSMLLLLLVIGTLVVLMRRVVRPLITLTRIVDQMVAGGDVDKSPDIDRQDEIGALARALFDFHLMQGELLRSEKMAALGGVVAAMAHEINTPLGNSLTVATTLTDILADFDRMIAGTELRRSALREFSQKFAAGQDIVVSNLTRAADLIGSFKQVAVDQTSERRRRFDLEITIREIITTLRPTFKQSGYQIVTEIAPGVEMDGYPGALAQVITNLVTNAVVHAFEGRAAGMIRIVGTAVDRDTVRLSVSDDGGGIPAKAITRIFDPFYTTKLGTGGSGLGLHIVYVTVRGVLGGSIAVESVVDQGTTFSMTLPRIAPPESMHAPG